MIKRREFLVGAAGFLPLSKMLAVPSCAPVMRIGVMTDTHVGKTVQSCGHIRQALSLFKAKGADVIVNNGDTNQIQNYKSQDHNHHYLTLLPKPLPTLSRIFPPSRLSPQS